MAKGVPFADAILPFACSRIPPLRRFAVKEHHLILRKHLLGRNSRPGNLS